MEGPYPNPREVSVDWACWRPQLSLLKIAAEYWRMDEDPHVSGFGQWNFNIHDDDQMWGQALAIDWMIELLFRGRDLTVGEEILMNLLWMAVIVSWTRKLLTQIKQVCSEICDIKVYSSNKKNHNLPSNHRMNKEPHPNRCEKGGEDYTHSLGNKKHAHCEDLQSSLHNQIHHALPVPLAPPLSSSPCHELAFFKFFSFLFYCIDTCCYSSKSYSKHKLTLLIIHSAFLLCFRPSRKSKARVFNPIT